MSREKIFPLKLSGNGQGALKEQVHKHISGDQTKIKVTYALDSELRLLEPVTYADGVFTSIKETTSLQTNNLQDLLLECKKDNKPIFYPLTSLTYICMQNIVMEKGQVTKNTINLYIPSRLDKTKLICNDISIMFPRQNRNTLASNYLSYSLSRV